LPVSQPYNERELLLCVANGDANAFTQLYDHYWNRIYSLARVYFKSAQTAEDVVQEVFLKVWLSRHTLPEVRAFRPFLLVMARNIFISKLRGTVFHVELGEDEAGLPPDDYLQPDYQLTMKEYHQLLNEAINALPAQQQRAYRLSRDGGKTYEEIAEKMQISPLTVRTHMSKALASIRQFLIDRSVHLAIIFLLLPRK
jgi:RNA polymerase sigma-70 factor (ECF subfamily)